MKKFSKIILLLLLTFAINSVHAQWINSITISPANPTSNDTITILAKCSFSHGTCDDHTQFVSVVGNNIYANALHCMGVLTVICDYTDTFKIAPLPIGNYNFYFQVDAGQGPSPCTPGFVPGPNDSISFVVSPFTGINEFINQDKVHAFPNPFGDAFQLRGIDASEFPVTIQIISSDGKLVKSGMLKDSDVNISLKEFPIGSYQLVVTPKNKKQLMLQLVKAKN